MLIIPAITLTTAKSLYGVLFTGESFSLDYLNRTVSRVILSDNGFFFVNLVAQNATFSFLFYLLRLDEFVMNNFSTFIAFYKRHFINNGK